MTADPIAGGFVLLEGSPATIPVQIPVVLIIKEQISRVSQTFDKIVSI